MRFGLVFQVIYQKVDVSAVFEIAAINGKEIIDYSTDVPRPKDLKVFKLDSFDVSFLSSIS